MKEKRRSFRELAQELKKLRKRPIPREEIEDFNKIAEEEERIRNEKPKEQQDKKIAQPPEAEL